MNSWVELKLSNLEFNIKQINHITNNSNIIAVVKSNAYGHGLLKLMPTFIKNNINNFAVNSLDEAIEIRKNFNDVNILIFGYTPLDICSHLWNYNLWQTVFNYEQAMDLSNMAMKYNKSIYIHIKIDTGMNRLGFSPDDMNIKKIYTMNNLIVLGIYSHFAMSDALDKTFSYNQLEKYVNVIQDLKQNGIKNTGLQHMSNSAAILDMKESYLDCVRPGKILYGIMPSDEIHNKLPIKPVLSLKCKIINIKYVNEHCCVGYNNSFITKRKSKIATLPIGYSDGYGKKKQYNMFVLVNNVIVPVIGNICMTFCMIDVTDIDVVTMGDVVTLYGNMENMNEITVDYIGKQLDKSVSEILCSISEKIPRLCI